MAKSVKKDIMVDRAIWSEFKNKCREAGKSTCEVLESFFKEFNRS